MVSDAESVRTAIDAIGVPEGKSCPSAPCIEGALLLDVMKYQQESFGLTCPRYVDSKGSRVSISTPAR